MNKLIFFIDDEPMFINLLEYTVKGRNGYDAVSFSSGEDCMEYMARTGITPTLAVVDYYLDTGGVRMNGLELIKRIRQSSPHTKFVFLTGNSDPAVISLAKALSAERYILKDGYFVDSLLNCLDEVLP
jgi:DNA-binding NarL/FixJ family response regulator